jgi:hypothetical protein
MHFSINIFGKYVWLYHFALQESGSGGNLALVRIERHPRPFTVSKSLQNA